MNLLYARIRTLCLLYIQENPQDRNYPKALDLDYTYGQKLTKRQFKYLYQLYKTDFEQHQKYHHLEFNLLQMLSCTFSYYECSELKRKNAKFDDWWCKVCSLVCFEVDFRYNSKWKTVSYGRGYKNN